MADDVLRIERDGHVAWIWLANPDRGNAMGPAFWTQLPEAMASVGADDEVRAVVIAAEGKNFTFGLDLKGMGGMLAGEGAAAGASDAQRRSRLLGEIRRLQGSITSVAECPKPVVAAVHGWCIGGGIDLISAADIRIASADARFSVRETRMAMVADIGTLQRLPGVLTRGHVAELVYTGKDIDSAEAERIGLVNRVHADVDSLHAAAGELAASIAANSPFAVQGAKEILMTPLRGQWDESLRLVATWNTAFLMTEDLGEAMAAFVQKRPPEFKGR